MAASAPPDVFKAAVAKLKEALVAEAAFSKGDAKQGENAVCLLAAGADMFVYAIDSGKYDKIKPALEQKQEQIKQKLEKLGAKLPAFEMDFAQKKGKADAKKLLDEVVAAKVAIGVGVSFYGAPPCFIRDY